MFNSMSRNNQVQAARARLAARQGVPGGAYAGNVAGCGPWGACDAPPGAPVGPFGPPNLAALDPGCVMNLNGVLPQYNSPFQVRATIDGDTQLELSCPGGAQVWGCGLRSLNLPNEVEVQITPGNLQIPLMCNFVDSAYWTTDECYCPFPIGCFSNVSPLLIDARPVGTPSVPPTLSLIIVGTLLRSAGCGPWIPPGPCGPGGGFPGGGFPGTGPGGYGGGNGGGTVPVP